MALMNLNGRILYMVRLRVFDQLMFGSLDATRIIHSYFLGSLAGLGGMIILIILYQIVFYKVSVKNKSQRHSRILF